MGHCALPFAGRTLATALAVEGKASRCKPCHFRLVGRGKQLSDRIPDAEEGGGRGTRRAANRRLVDSHGAYELLVAAKRFVAAWRFRDELQLLAQRRQEHVSDQRALARTAHPSHDRERAERNTELDV